MDWGIWGRRQKHTFLVILAGLPPLGPPLERLDFFKKKCRITLSLLLSHNTKVEAWLREKKNSKAVCVCLWWN